MLPEAPWEHPAFQYRQLNMLDAEAMCRVVETFQPDYIAHLASISSVGQSWKAPAVCFTNNTSVFLNLAEAVRAHCPEARVLSIGSSEEYGNYPPESMPLREDYELKPCNPYAVARVAQEMLSKLYAENYGLRIMMTRSFNHIGPHQRDCFVIPSFVKQLMEIKKNGGKGTMRVGNLDIVRDFLDVRDAVDAYWQILTKGNAGEIYNVCTGSGIRIKNIIMHIAKYLGVDPVIEVDNSLIRPTDNSVIIGDNSKITKYFNWKPRITLQESINDIIINSTTKES